VSRYQKGTTNVDFTEARDSEWQWHQLGHMQVCTSLQTNNHTTTPSLSFLQAGCPSCRPTNSVKALKATTHIHTYIIQIYVAPQLVRTNPMLLITMIYDNDDDDRPCYAKSSYRSVDPQTLHGNVHQVDHVPNGPTNSAAITTVFPLRLCGGKLLVAVTRERRYGPSRRRVSDRRRR